MRDMTYHAATNLAANHRDCLQAALAAWPADGAAATARAPAIADVMGGIGESSGSLVLTATLNLSFMVSLWKTQSGRLDIRFVPEGGASSPKEFSLAIDCLGASQTNGCKMIEACKKAGAEWAAPLCLTLDRAVASGFIQRPKGLAALVVTDFPPDVDLGRPTVLAAATQEALGRLEGAALDRAAKSRLCSDSISSLTGVLSIRTAMTCLAGSADGALLQICLHPQPTCEPLPMPPGVTIVAVRTSLNRPVSAERLVDTRLCAEMGHRVLQAALNGDGRALRLDRLAAITPTEFVERYRDYIPSRITGKQFVAKFGDFRGVNGESIAPTDVFKIRSRAEHHIYENRRVHEFATAINRARRANSLEPLVAAGELMYASHWSHSQRCGIGGVETDRMVSSLRRRGPADGLYGAKVTGGGLGGEMVVLMRDDPHSHAALASAIAEVQSSCQKAFHTYRGSLAGAELAIV